MISAVRRQCSLYSGTHQQLIQISQRIALFSDAFAPFFDIVNVFIQIKPDCAAIFWGTLWLIFKVYSRLSSIRSQLAFLTL